MTREGKSARERERGKGAEEMDKRAGEGKMLERGVRVLEQGT